MYQISSSQYIRDDENINIYSYITGDPEPEHTHEFIEMVYIRSGKGQHYVNGTCYNVSRGDLLFINFGQTHAFSAVDPMEIVNCLISPEFIDKELINSENAYEILTLSSFSEFGDLFDNPVPMIRFRGKELLEVEALIKAMISEFNDKDINYRTALKGYLQVLLTKVFRAMKRSAMDSIMQQMNRATPDILKHIEDSCLEQITLKELAQKCFYNPSYFSKVFKEYYGRSFTDYIHERRVNEAVRLLKETDLSIEAVSRKVGYQDRKQLYKIFKQFMDITPSQVRKPKK